MRSVDFDYIRELVATKSGISLAEDKQYLVKARLKPLLKRFNLPSEEHLVRHLRWGQNEGLVEAVIEVITTNETYFYRDAAPFNALRNSVIPDLIQRRAASKTIHIWCAACSTGQEPYSIAMLLREHFHELENWNVTILATDIAGDVLEKAKKGRYSQFEISRGLPEDMLKYFNQVDNCWEIKEEIRSMVEFQKGNLLKGLPSSYPVMDIIFLRNVLIYFEQELKRKVLSYIPFVLRHDGYLFLGQSETVSQLNVPFEACHLGTASCFRQNSHVISELNGEN